jgi:hypothetical protein
MWGLLNEGVMLTPRGLGSLSTAMSQSDLDAVTTASDLPVRCGGHVPKSVAADHHVTQQRSIGS